MQKVGITNEDIEPNEHVDQEYNPDQDKPINTGGAPKKDFEQLGRRMKLKRLDPLKKAAIKAAKENRGLSVARALEYVSEMVAHCEGDSERARMYKTILKEENPLKHKRMSVEKAVATKVHANLSRSTWETIREAVKGSVSIPSR